MSKHPLQTEPGFRTPSTEAQEAVIYCRVSSDRQAKEGDGAASQEQRCRVYAQGCGYQVLCSFSDDMTGAAIERPGLTALLSFVSARKRETGCEVVVLVDDISRIARDVIAHIQIRAAVRAAGGRMESPSFSFGESAADEMIETIMAATAQYGRKGNREQVLNRMRARLERGYWTFPPPPGYRYEKHPAHKKLLVPTKEARDVLAAALEGFASGRFQTQRELALHLREQGFYEDRRTVSLFVLEKRVSRMLAMLPLYAGMLEYPTWKIERRQAQHEAIISAGTLRRIEERLSGPGRPWGAAERADSKSLLILRNFVRCHGCGRPLTGDLAKGKYPRYHCYNQSCPLYGDSYSARKKLNPAFVDLLRSLEPRPEFIELVEMQVERVWEQQGQEWHLERTALQKELGGIGPQVQVLVRRLARVSSEAVAEEVEREIASLKARAAAIQERLDESGETAPDYRAAWKAVHTWFCDPAGMWESGSDKQKKTVHRIVFTVPPVYERDVGFHTYDLSLPYRVSASFGASDDDMVDLTGESSHLDSLDWKGWFECISRWASWVG